MKHRNDIDFNARLYGKQKFGFRKLSVGLAAVALGTTFLMTNGELVHADEVTQNSTSTKEVKSDKAIQPTPANGVEGVDQGDKHQQSESNSEDQKSVDSDVTPPSSPTNIQDDHIPTNTDSAPDKQNNEDKGTQLFNAKKSKSSAIDLEENKSEVNENNVSIITNKQSDGYIHVENGGKTGNISIKFNQDIKFDNDKGIVISIYNPNDNIEIDSATLPPSGWKFSSKNSNGDTEYSFINNTGKAKQLLSDKINFTISANNNIDSTQKIDNVLITNISINGNKCLSEPYPLNIQIDPYKDTIDNDELLHGFIMGPKVIFDPSKPDSYDHSKGFVVNSNGNYYYIDNDSPAVKYTGPETNAITDPSEIDGKLDDARLMQYGIDWNFGQGANDSGTLQNVLAHIKFSDGQKIIPGSIRVFKITDPSAVKDAITGSRANINKVYENLTTWTNRDQNFEYYLESLVSHDAKDTYKDNQITIDQTGEGRTFTIPKYDANGNKISEQTEIPTGAYFIQVDTQIKPDYYQRQIPGNGPAIFYPVYNEKTFNPAGHANKKMKMNLIHISFLVD